MNSPDPKQQARELLASGRAPEAKALYERLAAANASDPEIWDALGQIEAMGGDWKAAEARFRQAVAANPAYAPGHCNLGVVLQEVGDLAGAAECYERALKLQPDAGARTLYERSLTLEPRQVEPRLALGTLFEKEKKLAEARECYEAALALAPRHPRVHFNLGNVALADKRLEDAETHYREALKLDPRHAECWNNLGNTLVRNDRAKEAVECFEQATRLNPRHSGAWNNLGNCLNLVDEPERGIEALKHALELKPEYADAWNNLGIAYATQEKLPDAMDCYHKAIEHNPEHVGAWRNAAELFGKGNRFDDAVRYYEQALALDADAAENYAGLGSMLIKSQRLEEGLARVREAIARAPDHRGAHNSLLFCENYSLDLSPEQIFADHKRWGERFGEPDTDLGAPAAPAPLAGRRLRIGYVSGDFRAHSVSFFIEPVLKAHDHARIEIFCYSELAKAKHDKVTERIKPLADHWFDTAGVNNADLVKQIRADGIDILVDLAGHTAHNRLHAFAYRPAPVQASWIGYCNTTGLPAMDYRFTDEWADPEGYEAYHTEKLVRLPAGFLCYSPPAHAPEVVALPREVAGHVTFGSFNNLSKVNPQTTALWARVLGAVPGSRLLIKSKSLADAATCDRLAERFASHGIERERLEFIGWLPKSDEHLGLYGRVDIALDTFPYNGTTTTCEALWMGVPVIALEGNRHAARVGVSLLSRISLQELIARDTDDYVRRAEELAADPERLRALRTGMRERMRGSALCDPERFTRALEDTYYSLWEEACRQPARVG